MTRLRSSPVPTPALPTPDAIFSAHLRGKLEVTSRVPLETMADLAIAYTPGVAQVCEAIAADPPLADRFTWRANTVAVVSDGTAVLGLGALGAAAALPVMEGKALLFRQLGNVNAVPIVLDTQDVDEIVATVANIAPGFGGINLEDISAPRCFEIERLLDERLNIPVFHDDQHGTAIVVLAALLNASVAVDRGLGELKVVVRGAGAAGSAVCDMLSDAGVGDVIVADRGGVLHPSRPGLTPHKQGLAARTNRYRVSGSLSDALQQADVFIGLSGGLVPNMDLLQMPPGGIIFALANPEPEVDLEMARHHATVVATGRSDLPNQINNLLAFPGVFRGALDSGARTISPAMKRAAAHALAKLAGGGVDAIVPHPLDPRVGPAVGRAVAAAAVQEDVA